MMYNEFIGEIGKIVNLIIHGDENKKCFFLAKHKLKCGGGEEEVALLYSPLSMTNQYSIKPVCLKHSFYCIADHINNNITLLH